MTRRSLRAGLVGAVLALGLAGAGAFTLGEFYNLTAIQQHPAWLFRAIVLVRETVIGIDAGDVEVPPDFAPEATPATVALYQKHCAHCHGAPGIAPEEFALGMLPTPPPLVSAGRHRPPEEIFWYIKYGLKMSGMPAWERRMSEPDMWRITSVVAALPRLAPVEYKALLEAGPGTLDAITPVAATETWERDPSGFVIGDPEAGRRAIRLYGCRTCHLIPGIVGAADVRVGPDLARAGNRRYVAGVLRNTPENMVRWIMAPQAVDPLSAMPDLGVSRRDAQDIAAYLYSVAPEDEVPPWPERLGRRTPLAQVESVTTEP